MDSHINTTDLWYLIATLHLHCGRRGVAGSLVYLGSHHHKPHPSTASYYAELVFQVLGSRLSSAVAPVRTAAAQRNHSRLMWAGCASRKLRSCVTSSCVMIVCRLLDMFASDSSAASENIKIVMWLHNVHEQGG